MRHAYGVSETQTLGIFNVKSKILKLKTIISSVSGSNSTRFEKRFKIYITFT